MAGRLRQKAGYAGHQAHALETVARIPRPSVPGQDQALSHCRSPAEAQAERLRLLALSGAGEKESIKLRWAGVDFDHKLLTIGAGADTKNREARRVDFNAELETLLKAMQRRRAPDSQWMFPSPQRGNKDVRAKTFRESLLSTRAVSGFVCQDCKQITLDNEAPKACPKC